MKRDRLILVSISFLIGVLICYFFCQYKYLVIDTEINIVESVISVLGLSIGLYIAVTFDRQKNKSQNFYTYVEKKFDELWQDFITLNEKLEYNSNIELTEISKSFKSIYQKIAPLKKIFEASEYNVDCIKLIEVKIDELDTYLCNIENTTQYVVPLDLIKTELNVKLNNINETFAKSYKELNNI